MGLSNSSQVMPSNDNTNNKKFVIGIIDVQNDFCKGGSLAVDEADFIIGAINKLRYRYDDYMQTFISQDWHHKNHMSFATTHNKKPYDSVELSLEMDDGTINTVKQTLWPSHCIENTYGSQLHNDLVVLFKDKFIKKGTKRNVESYSAFGDAEGGKYEKTDLNDWLKQLGITDIILTGIATDYCVYSTAKDAIKLGYTVHMISSCTRGVAQNTTNGAIEDLSYKGVKFYDSVDDFHSENKQYIVTDNKYLQIPLHRNYV